MIREVSHVCSCRSQFFELTPQSRGKTEYSSDLLFYNIYILSVFTEKLYSEAMEHNVVYISITTLSHATSVTST